MRYWSASAPATATRPRPEAPRDLALQIDEGYLVALSALRMSVKNGIIMRILRDGAPWNEQAASELARRAIDTLVAELSETAVRLSNDSVIAAPTARQSRGARSRRDVARVGHGHDESERLGARSRVMRGVVDRLAGARDDTGFVLNLALRARDDTLGELMQARLTLRAQPQLLSEEEQREAIEGVKADLQLLIDERAGY